MDDWSDDELAGAVDAYREMQALQAARQQLNKRGVYRELSARYGRSAKAFEYRMQNISAVLNELGQPWLSGLKPAGNVGTHVKPRLIVLLARSEKISVASPAAESSELLAKLPLIRSWLTEVARKQESVAPENVMDVFGLNAEDLPRAIAHLRRQSHDLGEPSIAGVIEKPMRPQVAKSPDGPLWMPSSNEPGLLHKFWANELNSTEVPAVTPESPLEIRAARFVCVETRPQQAVFRRNVFIACQGECVVSNCDVLETLDAAHRHGRDWRRGHNRATDGFLLRKDLHALYDAALLSIAEDGLVEFAPAVRAHYKAFHGIYAFKMT